MADIVSVVNEFVNQESSNVEMKDAESFYNFSHEYFEYLFLDNEYTESI